MSQQQTLDELRASLERIESGSLSSDLFDEPGEREPEDRDGTSAPPPAAAPASVDQNDYTKARAVVLRKLTGSAKSRHQLAQALAEKEFSDEVAAAVLDRLEDVGLVDDAAFAETWVRTRHELKGLGAAVLRRELQQKGVAPAHTEAALGQLTAEDETAAARELVQNKLRSTPVPLGESPEERKEQEKITRRLVNMLARRGHSPGTAFNLVKEELQARAAR